MDLIFTPNRKLQTPRYQRSKRFTRKPAQRSQRSSSKKSFDSSVKEMYIKSPTAMNKQKVKQNNFFTVLAEQLLSKDPQTQLKQSNKIKYKQRISEPYNQEQLIYRNLNFRDQQQTTQKKNLQPKIKVLEQQIQLKNHQISVLTGQIQRYKAQFDQEKQKRRKFETQNKKLTKQLKQIIKGSDALKSQIKKYEKQKQHLMKQIQFLQRINYDEKTRSLQSYRQKYLDTQLQKIKKQLQKSKTQREQELQKQIRIAKQEKFTIQSHYKAMKVANQCLIKQINFTQENMHDIILNSDQYKKLRNKYIRFLQQYEQLRSQYCAFKAEFNLKNQANDSSSLFSITASQVEQDLTLLLRNQSFTSNISAKQATLKSHKSQSQKQKHSHLDENGSGSQPFYSYK